MATLIRNARVLTFDKARHEYARADVYTNGRKVVAVQPDLRMADFADLAHENIELIDGAGKLVSPGLINAHLHSPANFLKAAIGRSPSKFSCCMKCRRWVMIPRLARDSTICTGSVGRDGDVEIRGHVRS